MADPTAGDDAAFGTYSWAYRCSACEELVNVDLIQAHVDAHHAEKDYGDSITLSHVDRPEPD